MLVIRSRSFDEASIAAAVVFVQMVVWEVVLVLEKRIARRWMLCLADRPVTSDHVWEAVKENLILDLTAVGISKRQY
jgi:hypothetical protein